MPYAKKKNSFIFSSFSSNTYAFLDLDSFAMRNVTTTTITLNPILKSSKSQQQATTQVLVVADGVWLQ